MRRFPLDRRIAAALSLLVAITGCARIGGPTPPSRFYLLDPLAKPPATGSGGLAVGVGPVHVAEYLDRPQIVTRHGENGIDLAEYDRWGEPLSEGIPRVVAMNLGGLLGSERVLRQLWREADLDARVGIDVRRLDGPPAGPVVLQAHWRVQHKGGAIERVSLIEEPVSGSGFEGVAAASSRALFKLSQEIATAIGTQP